MPDIAQSLWEALQARMYASSAKRLLGHMRRLLRRRSNLLQKMSKNSMYYVDGYGSFRTQVLEIDDQLQQALLAIERLAHANEAMQRLVEEARRIVAQAQSQPDSRGIVDTPAR